jgi:ABC-type transporter Mla subunit MlaD
MARTKPKDPATEPRAAPSHKSCCPEHAAWHLIEQLLARIDGEAAQRNTHSKLIAHRLANIERILKTMSENDQDLATAVDDLGGDITSLITTFDTKFAELTATVKAAGISAEAESAILAKVGEIRSSVASEAAKLGGTPAAPPTDEPPATT